MKVLVATIKTQGHRDNDFCWAQEGELVYFPLIQCTQGTVDDQCGCRRSMSGVQTLKATTTVRVADLDIDVDELRRIISNSMTTGGWNRLGEKAVETMAREQAAELARVAAEHGVGTILERREHGLEERLPAVFDGGRPALMH